MGSILWLSLSITILVTLFGRNLFERAIQNVLHFMVDTNEHNDGDGGFEVFNLCTIFFCIFNVAVFAFFGNIDYLLMVACGYLYGDDEHEWTVGSAVYCISNMIGCSVAFAIGRALFKDKIYFLLSKHEKYRYFQRVFTDHSLLLSIAFNLNPFIPSGLIVYGLSISSMTWMRFCIGQCARIPNAAIMAYSGYIMRREADNEPIENTNIDFVNIDNAYKSNTWAYGFTVTFCIIFAVMTLFIAFRMYLQFQRLVLGTDALKKAEEENSGYSDDEYSVTHSNEEMNGADVNDTSSESEDTLDEYGFPNDSKKEKFLFEDEYDSNPNHSDKLPIDNQTDSDFEELDASDFEIEVRKKKQSKKKRQSKNQLLAPKKNKKRKKGIKLNSKIWQTIVLSHSPREDESMLFEEGTDA